MQKRKLDRSFLQCIKLCVETIHYPAPSLPLQRLPYPSGYSKLVSIYFAFETPNPTDIWSPLGGRWQYKYFLEQHSACGKTTPCLRMFNVSALDYLSNKSKHYLDRPFHRGRKFSHLVFQLGDQLLFSSRGRLEFSIFLFDVHVRLVCRFQLH